MKQDAEKSFRLLSGFLWFILNFMSFVSAKSSTDKSAIYSGHVLIHCCVIIQYLL